MKYLSLIVFFAIAFTLTATGQGLQFDSSFHSWAEVMQKAKQMNKPVFVDVYTTWCGPCKWMDVNVFNTKEIGSFFNNKYLSVKIDAEKEFGKSFAGTYHVNAFPTYLFFSPDGELLLAGIGSKKTSEFLQIGSDALTNWKNGMSLQAMKAKLAAGNYDPSFLEMYIKKISSLLIPNALIVEQYLNAIPEDSLYTPKTLSLVSRGYFGRMQTESAAFKVLLHAYKKYPVKSFELMSPWNTIRSRLMEYVDSAGRQQDTAWLKDIMAANHKIDTILQVANRESDFFLCKYFSAANDSIKFMHQAHNFINNYVFGVNPDSLYSSDINGFQNALLIKFGTADVKKLKENAAYKNFRIAYFTDSRILLYEVMEIMYMSNSYFKDKSSRSLLKEWLQAAIKIYASNPVHVNTLELNNIQKKMVSF